MRFLPFLLALSASVIRASKSEHTDSATISIQPILSSGSPTQLAEIAYNPSTLSSSITNYIPPDLPSYDPSVSSPASTSLLRIGIYDSSTQTWKSSTSLTSSNSFSRGYSPTIVLVLGKQGEVVGVSIKSSLVDAGQTRDFGPKVIVRGTVEGKRPELNRPVVLSPEGKLEVEEKEKTLLQR
jgi:hypothetical protein